MKILIAVAYYPDDKGGKSRYYTHVRNLYYHKLGEDITVLNFATRYSYTIDGINVISLEEYTHNYRGNFDILVSHAPNLRNHFRFIKRFHKDFAEFVYFFHGQEVMSINRYYPKPYNFFKKRTDFLRTISQGIYDKLKFLLWKSYWGKTKSHNSFVFVSDWMKRVFEEGFSCKSENLAKKIEVINNSVGADFEEESFSASTEKTIDFLTVRSSLDLPKYGIDVVAKLAVKYPKLNFTVVGRGNFFNYIRKPTNLTLISREMSHDEIVDLLKQSRAALMPTRQDTQGVMACEMATFGIPLVTSSIDVMHEIFSSFSNVWFIDNENPDLGSKWGEILRYNPSSKNTTYFEETTIQREVDLYHNLEQDLNFEKG